MLAALAAAEPCEASSAVEKYGQVEQASFGQQAWVYATYLMIILITYGSVRLYDRVCGLLGRGPRQFSSVASQTQTTYTEVRGAAQPRFRVLPEHSHG